MNRSQFQKLLASRFYPELRKEGFKGSGTTLRRIAGPLVHVFNFQGSSCGRGFYINLGAHLDFLGGEPLAKLKGSGCAFRIRLDPPNDDPVRRWHYGGSEADAIAIIDELGDVWCRDGRSFFARYADYPASFEKLIEEANTNEMYPNYVFTYAKIAAQLGRSGQARDMVCEAIPRTGERATSLRGHMKAFLREL